MYISRKFPAQTSFRAPDRNRKDRARNPDGTSRANRPAPKMNGNESPGPIPPVARNFPATTPPMCTMGRMRRILLRTIFGKPRAQGILLWTRSLRKQAGEKLESLRELWSSHFVFLDRPYDGDFYPQLPPE